MIQNNSQKEQNPSTVAENTNVINSLSNGCYNPNISMNTLSSNGKNKSKSKKQKSQESLLRIKEVVSPKEVPDKSDKTVAILNNDNSRPVLNRFNSVYVVLFILKFSSCILSNENYILNVNCSNTMLSMPQ